MNAKKTADLRSKQRQTEGNDEMTPTSICRRSLAGIVLVLAAIALLTVPGSAQSDPRAQLGKTSDKELAFDYSGNAADGTPLISDAAEFVFRSAGGAPIRVKVDAAIAIGENRFQVAALLGGVPDGDYDSTVRIRGENGNWSDESSVLQVTVSSKKPDAPLRFREIP